VRRRPLRAAAALTLTGALAACGTPSRDLFVVDRTGSLPDAKLTLRVGDGSTVRCDGGEEKPFGNHDLLVARQIEKDLKPLLDKNVALPAAEGSVLQYRVTGGEGVVRFADNSGDKPKVFAEIIRLTRTLAMEACGRER
jgi:hypothetical protein